MPLHNTAHRGVQTLITPLIEPHMRAAHTRLLGQHAVRIVQVHVRETEARERGIERLANRLVVRLASPPCGRVASDAARCILHACLRAGCSMLHAACCVLHAARCHTRALPQLLQPAHLGGMNLVATVKLSRGTVAKNFPTTVSL
jgi:hypothetical protein